MSERIECDKCHKMMWTDSRSDKGAYCKLAITYVNDYSTYHLCATCYRQLMVEFMREWKAEEFDDEYGDWIKKGEFT